MSLALPLIPSIAAGGTLVTGGISAFIKGTAGQQKAKVFIIAPLVAAAVTAAFISLNTAFGVTIAALSALFIVVTVDPFLGHYFKTLLAEMVTIPALLIFTALLSTGTGRIPGCCA